MGVEKKPITRKDLKVKGSEPRCPIIIHHELKVNGKRKS